MGNLCATFKLFGLEHFVYILLGIVVCTVCIWLFKKFEEKQKLIKIIILSLIGFFVVLEYVGRIIGQSKFNFFENLPINAFQIFAVICLVILIKNKASWSKFAYLIMVPVSILSIIFIPNFYTTLSGFSLAIVSFVFVNICVIIFSILNILWGQDEISHRDVIDATISFVIFVAVAHILNVFLRFTAWGLNADYFGTMAENYNLYIGWVSYLIPIPFVCHLPLIALLVGVEYLCKLPFDLFKTKREHREQMEELVALGNLKAQQKYREAKRQSGSQILIKNNSQSTSGTASNISRKEDFIPSHKEVETHKDEE